MQRRLGGRIDGGTDQRHMRKAGGDVDDRRILLPLEMIDERIDQPDRPEQIGGDRRLGIVEPAGGIDRLIAHDACVVDQNVEPGEIGDQPPGESGDASRIVRIEGDRVHVGPPRDRAVQRLLAASGDDDGIAQIVEALGDRLADARSAAGDQDGVSADVHL